MVKPHKHGERISKKFKVREWHIWTALAIAALSVIDALYLWKESKHLPEALHGAAEAAILLLIAELVVIVLLEQDEFLRYAKGAIERTATPMVQFENFVEEKSTHPLLRLLGGEAIRDLLRTYRFSDRSWVVSGQRQAIDSYLAFWQFLVDTQKTMRQGISVRAVHSLNMDIWREDKMRAILEKQGEFIASGGEIRRLLISAEKPDRSEKPDEAHLAVIKDMVDRRISVTFVRRDEFDFDFLVAPSLDIAVTWTGTVMARRIQRVEYFVGVSDDDKQAFKAKWEAGNIGAIDASKLLK